MKADTPVLLYLAEEREGSREERSMLLNLAADAYAQARGLEKRPWRMARHGYGKPYFENAREIFFSISHSGKIWGCAFSDAPVGLDIQIHTECDKQRIADRFFHPKEAEAIALHPEWFFQIWTAKESYIKYLAKGFYEDFSSFSVIEVGTHPNRAAEAYLTKRSACDG